jgi:sugar transferase (PEP-CTERM/EpsH1 system associated)
VRILFLSHRIPYPPDKGDKIRSFRLLEALARRHEVRLITHADDPRDLRHLPELLRICRSASVYSASRLRRAVRIAAGLLSGRALSFAKFHDRRAAREVRRILETDRPDVIVVFSAQPAEYVPAGSGVPVVVDLVDVDSEKWAAYARTSRGPMRWLYGREARIVRAFERALATTASRISVATDREAAQFRAAVSSRHVATVPNGVDVRPDGAGRRVPGLLVFAGAMDYEANADAATFAARSVLPLIRADAPHATLRIIGRNPGRAVRSLASLPGVEVSGEVADVGREVARAEVSLLPLRMVRGVPNKLLESFAHGVAVVTTPAALEAVGAAAGEHAFAAEDAPGLAACALRLLRDPSLRDRVAESGRRLAAERFRWDRFETGMLSLVDEAVHGRAAWACG